MFDTRFNNSFQNADPNNPYSQYQNMPYGSNDPYAAYNNVDPSQMNNIPYPTPPTQTAMPQQQNLNPVGYASGGNVKSGRDNSSQAAENPRAKNKPYHVLAEMIRQQGKGEDTVLAHINPLEAMMLKQMGGSGTINKETGLPQFGLFSNPKKWFKSVIGPGLGVLLGNMILPGIGGSIGGAIGGAAGSKIRGRKDAGEAALRGFGMGSIAPTVADLAGSGLSALGAPGAGGALSEYGNKNAIMPAIDKLFGFGGGSSSQGMGALPAVFSANNSRSALQNYNRANGLSGVSSGDDYGDEEDYGIKKRGKKSDANFLDKLMSNAGDYLSKPKNLLTAASAAASLLNRPKKETPEKKASEQKRFEKALMLTPSERAAREADLLAEAKMQRSIARNKFLPEERLGNLDPLYRKSHTPEEQKRLGSWFSYYNNPNFTGEPMPFKEGGMLPDEMMQGAEEMAYPSTLGNYIMGNSKGQDDDVNAKLSNGEFVIPADIVADLGDGNNNAGANVLYELMNNVRKHKRGGKVKLPPKAKPVSNYLK